MVTSIRVVAVIAIAATFAYTNYFGPKTALQTNHDSINCRQVNVLDGVDRQDRFTVLSICERVIGVVHNMKGTKQDDGAIRLILQLMKLAKGFLTIRITNK